MTRIERFQSIRPSVRLHMFDKLPPIPLDRYDSALPRPAPWLFRWYARRLIDGRVRSPVTGIPYRPDLPPWLSERTPAPVVWRDGRWQFPCAFAGPGTGCARAFLNAYEEIKHVQAVHLSPNDRPAMLNGAMHRPESWHRLGRVTDAAGRQEATDRRVAYRRRLRSLPRMPWYARSLARRLS